MPTDVVDPLPEAHPDRRVGAVVAVAIASLLSIVAVSVAVVTTSVAAFTDNTSTGGSSFSTGTVDLVDDDANGVLFTAAGLVPGQSVTGCIRVTYQGTVANPGPVRLYSGGFTDSGTLGNFLNVTIEEGTGGTFGNCAGFVLENTIQSGGTLTAFNTARTNYTNGAGVWDPASTPQSKTFRITVALSGSTPNAQQGQTVTNMAFVWEVQS